MTEEEKEAIENLEMYRANNSNYDEELANDIDTVLDLLQKKDKQIDLMAKRINDEALGDIICKEIDKEENCRKTIKCKECIKQYFEKQAEEV